MSNKIGIVGCGAAAKLYYVPALKRIPEMANNVYFVDKNIYQAENLSKEFGGGVILDDYHQILDKVQGVIIALPHFLHYSVSMDFLNAGIHVLCEKPLAESPEQVVTMISTAKKMNAGLCVNNTARMLPFTNKIKDLIQSGTIGQIKSVQFQMGGAFDWPSSTGFYVDPKISSKGIILDLGPHVIDLACWWLNERPQLLECKDDSFGGPESVAHIQATASNAKLDIFLNRLCDIDSHYEIVGTKGAIKGRYFDWKKISLQENGNTRTVVLPSRAKEYPEYVIPIVENFLQVTIQKEAPLVSGGDVLNSISMIDDCYRQRSRFNSSFYDGIKVEPSKIGRTLVTGAAGFIGGRAVERLFLSKQRSVRAGIRQWSSAARLGRFPLDIMKVDLLKIDEIEKAMDGITEIIHCVNGPGEVNVVGTGNLLKTALKFGVKRFVHLSTADIYGDVEGEITEDASFRYTGIEYNRTKIDAEKLCWEYIDKGLPITIIRPSIVYGPFSKLWSMHFAQQMIEGRWGIYEKFGEGMCNLIYVDDLINSILTALDNDDAIGQAFNVRGNESVTWNEYFEKYNDAMGLEKLKRINVQQSMLKTVMITPVRGLGRFVKNNLMGPVKTIASTFDIAKSIMKQTEKIIKSTPDFDDYKLFSKNAVFSNDKIAKLIGFTPSVSLDEGLRMTVDWLCEQRLLFKRND